MLRRWGWVAMAVVAALLLAGCNKPQDYAAADGMRQKSADASADAAVIRAAREAELAASMPTTVARDGLVNVGVGVGAAILAIGGALAVVAFVRRRAVSVYPNAAGQYPLVVERDWRTGNMLVHDPNRALGASTLYTGAGQKPMLVSAPMGADVGVQAQITTQAQAHQLLVAGTRTAAAPADPIAVARTISENAFRSVDGLPRMPSIRVIADPRRESHLSGLLKGAGDDRDTDDGAGG